MPQGGGKNPPANAAVSGLAARNRRPRLEDFAKPALDLRPSRVTEDIIGECYSYLISRFASDAGKKAGEFYTPTAVSRLLANRLDRRAQKVLGIRCGNLPGFDVELAASLNNLNLGSRHEVHILRMERVTKAFVDARAAEQARRHAPDGYRLAREVSRRRLRRGDQGEIQRQSR